MKLSFSLPSKPFSTKPKPSNFHQENPQNENPKPEFVTEFDSSRIISQKPKYVIPKQEKTLRPMKKLKNIHFPSSDLQFEVANPVSNVDSGMGYGLNLRKREDGFENGVDGDLDQPKPDSVENLLVQKFKQDMIDLPDDRGIDEFDEVPLEEFGAALLAGYGWTEGKGIGRNAKEDVKVVQYERRAGKEGLGFTSENHNAKKKGSKDSVMREEKPNIEGSDGRTRNAAGLDGNVVLREARGLFVGKIVRIVDGPHVGMKGEVLEKLGGDGGASKVVLRLLKSEEEVSVGEDKVADLGSVGEERCLKRLKMIRREMHKEKRDYGSRGERRNSSSKYDDGRKDRRMDNSNGGDERFFEAEHDRRERRNSSSKYDDGRKDKRMDKSNGGDGRVFEAEHDRSHGYGSRNGHGEDLKGGKNSWLTSHIRVRVISKDFKGGRLYRKKGEIMDVVGPLTCDISMDDSKELIQGVNQSILETALPKPGGSVLVLFGRHKGIFGKLVTRDTENETAMVQDADTHEMLTMRLDEIAEYIGDPSYIGY